MPRDYKQLPIGDLDLTTGNVVLGESTQQHGVRIAMAAAGHLRRVPNIFVDARSFKGSRDTGELNRRIRSAMTKDGAKEIKYKDGQWYAKY